MRVQGRTAGAASPKPFHAQHNGWVALHASVRPLDVVPDRSHCLFMLLDVVPPDQYPVSPYLLLAAGVVGLAVLWFLFQRRKNSIDSK